MPLPVVDDAGPEAAANTSKDWTVGTAPVDLTRLTSRPKAPFEIRHLTKSCFCSEKVISVVNTISEV